MSDHKVRAGDIEEDEVTSWIESYSARLPSSCYLVAAAASIAGSVMIVVGGVVQTISAWLSGTIDLDPAQLVDQLGSLLDELAEPQLYRD